MKASNFILSLTVFAALLAGKMGVEGVDCVSNLRGYNIHIDANRFVCAVNDNGNYIPGSGDGTNCYYQSSCSGPSYSPTYDRLNSGVGYGWIFKRDRDTFPVDRAVSIGHESGETLYVGICNNVNDNGITKNVAGKIRLGSEFGDKLQISGGGWGRTCTNYWVLACFDRVTAG